MNMDYEKFLENKKQLSGNFGFGPLYLPDFLFDFQKYLVTWALKKGRSAIFADCGLGKTPMALVWAENIVRKTNGNVLILTPLAVSYQFITEGEKFGIEVKKSRDGKPNGKITVINYQQLEKFNADDFAGVVCDESSILKNFKGEIKNQITQFMKKLKYRLLCTATAAPNDFIELGTSSESLGELGYTDMLNKFFKNQLNTSGQNRNFGNTMKWLIKEHAKSDFWRWVCSWSRAVRKPSDIGFSDENYKLPELIETEIQVENHKKREDVLFETEAVGLKEQREVVRITINDRCQKVADIVNNSNDFFLVWCNLNEEGKLLNKLIPDSIEVSGSDTDENKEKKLLLFSKKKVRVLITKPKIAGFGLNFQHCNNITFFLTHSFEQYYQGVRRCWRFGQTKNVNVYIITTIGEQGILSNLQRKQKQADEMFVSLVENMNNILKINITKKLSKNLEMPKWL